MYWQTNVRLRFGPQVTLVTLLVKSQEEFHQIHNLGALGTVIDCLISEVKRSKVKVTSRLNMVKKGGGICIDGLPSISS